MELVVPLVFFGVTLAIGWLARRLLLRALDLWSQRTHSRFGRVLTESLRGPTWIWIVILAAHLGIQSSDLPAKVIGILPTVLLDLWVISLTLMCMRIARNLVRYYGEQSPGALPV